MGGLEKAKKVDTRNYYPLCCFNYLVTGEDLFSDREIESNPAGFDKSSKMKKISRRVRGKNIIHTNGSDYEDELRSVASDNPHLYVSVLTMAYSKH